MNWEEFENTSKQVRNEWIVGLISDEEALDRLKACMKRLEADE